MCKPADATPSQVEIMTDAFTSSEIAGAILKYTQALIACRFWSGGEGAEPPVPPELDIALAETVRRVFSCGRASRVNLRLYNEGFDELRQERGNPKHLIDSQGFVFNLLDRIRPFFGDEEITHALKTCYAMSYDSAGTGALKWANRGMSGMPQLGTE